MTSSSNTPTPAAMEQALLSDNTIKQAKVFSLSTESDSDDISTQAVAISLVEPDATAVKRARKSLVKTFGKENVSKKWFVINHIPTLAAEGDEEEKIDVDALRKQVLAPAEDAAAPDSIGGEASSVEDRLRQIIAGALKLPVVEVTSKESFIRLGGDSITAIEVMTRCVESKIFLRVPDIMRAESISELAASVAPIDSEAGSNTEKVTNEIFASAVAQLPSYWACDSNWQDEEDRETKSIRVSGKVAETLISGSELVSRTLATQVCTAAVVDAFHQTFQDRETLAALVTPEGEDTIPLDLMLSRENENFTQTVRSMRDSFAAGQTLGKLSSLEEIPAVEMSIRFNTSNNVTPKSMFDVEISLDSSNKSVYFDFTFPRDNFPRKNDISSWMEKCQTILDSGVPSLPNPSSLYSLSDFPLLSFTYPELDKFINETKDLGYSDVEAAYPCSSVQNGILIGQLKRPEIYRIDCVFEVKNTDSPEQGVELDRLESAWNDLVAYHGALRTIFTAARGGAGFDQVVLKSITPDIKRLDTAFADADAAKKALDDLEKLVIVTTAPAHRLTTSKTQDGKVFCKIEVSHALVDGMSGSIIFRDLGRAYGGQLPKDTQGPSFEKFVEFLQGKDLDESLNYWLRYLDGMEPCNFPVISDSVNKASKEAEIMMSVPVSLEDLDTQAFCKSQGVTFATLMQAVWGTVLRAYTQSNDVCFGYLASGRDDTSVDGLQSMIGVLIHLLLCRIQFDEKTSFGEVMKKLHLERGPGMDNQFVSLADIQHSMAMGDSRLFNTLMSIIFPPPTSQGEQAVQCEQVHNVTATEVSRSIPRQTLDKSH